MFRLAVALAFQVAVSRNPQHVQFLSARDFWHAQNSASEARFSDLQKALFRADAVFVGIYTQGRSRSVYHVDWREFTVSGVTRTVWFVSSFDRGKVRRRIEQRVLHCDQKWIRHRIGIEYNAKGKVVGEWRERPGDHDTVVQVPGTVGYALLEEVCRLPADFVCDGVYTLCDGDGER